tara:strand:+ start:2628 stop:3062 length:435 start_codon:yes stop_codon:yes gene_type:complete
MRALIQRVSSAKVEVENKTISSINDGLLIFIGIYFNDTLNDIDKLYNKVLNMRIFEDKNKFSVSDIKGEILLVSQFTLCADTRRGNRPSFKSAMEPKSAKKMFDCLVNKFKNSKLKIEEGKFGELMNITLKNNGPMTIFLDTKS